MYLEAMSMKLRIEYLSTSINSPMPDMRSILNTVSESLLMERASDDFIIDTARRIVDVFVERMAANPLPPKTAESIPHIRIRGDVFTEEEADSIQSWRDRFLAWSDVTIGFVSEDMIEANGNYNIAQQAISIKLHKYKLLYLRKYWSASAENNAKLVHLEFATVFKTLVHELRHAYDAQASDPDCSHDFKFHQTRADLRARELRQKAENSNEPVDKERALRAYRTSPIEVSARITAAIQQMREPGHVGIDWEPWWYEFKQALGWYDVLSPNTQKRVQKRAYEVWSKLQEPNPSKAQGPSSAK